MMEEKQDPFAEPSPTSGLRSFDAFPKTRQTYTIKTKRGGLLTACVLVICVFLTFYELRHYISGSSHQHFHVEKSLGHAMQINLDITVAMPCKFLDINVQDAAGDRLLAGSLLKKEKGDFQRKGKKGRNLHGFDQQANWEVDEDLDDVIGKGTVGKWKGGKGTDDACRIYGSMSVHKVQGDFHITVKGHGYFNPGEHVEHDAFNLSHIIDELSFGHFFPKMINPLDGIKAVTEKHMYRYQYFLSIVPTLYQSHTAHSSILTNQYAVTEAQKDVSHGGLPSISFKYDIEPISIIVEDMRIPFLQFFVRLVNVISGVLVSTGWLLSLWDTYSNVVRKRRASYAGMLGVKRGEEEDRDE